LEVVILQFLQFAFFFVVSVLKGAGAYFAFAIADRLFEIAYINKGWWLICYGLALVTAFAGVWCIVESFLEFAEGVSGLGGDEA
jgi:hypothetical protein